ncbi:hypothetical protein AB6A40_001307 [Gnathostoma spinigerum]|uniref:Uncharacterized protein n=1 Tax=Gnathostoma spinigerum TaxID=75299 RepID=A0ABD6E414_9BILA
MNETSEYNAEVEHTGRQGCDVRKDFDGCKDTSNKVVSDIVPNFPSRSDFQEMREPSTKPSTEPEKVGNSLESSSKTKNLSVLLNGLDRKTVNPGVESYKMIWNTERWRSLATERHYKPKRLMTTLSYQKNVLIRSTPSSPISRTRIKREFSIRDDRLQGNSDNSIDNGTVVLENHKMGDSDDSAYTSGSEITDIIEKDGKSHHNFATSQRVLSVESLTDPKLLDPYNLDSNKKTEQNDSSNNHLLDDITRGREAKHENTRKTSESGISFEIFDFLEDLERLANEVAYDDSDMNEFEEESTEVVTMSTTLLPTSNHFETKSGESSKVLREHMDQPNGNITASQMGHTKTMTEPPSHQNFNTNIELKNNEVKKKPDFMDHHKLQSGKETTFTAPVLTEVAATAGEFEESADGLETTERLTDISEAFDGVQLMPTDSIGTVISNKADLQSTIEQLRDVIRQFNVKSVSESDSLDSPIISAYTPPDLSFHTDKWMNVAHQPDLSNYDSVEIIPEITNFQKEMRKTESATIPMDKYYQRGEIGSENRREIADSNSFLHSQIEEKKSSIRRFDDNSRTMATKIECIPDGEILDATKREKSAPVEQKCKNKQYIQHPDHTAGQNGQAKTEHKKQPNRNLLPERVYPTKTFPDEKQGRSRSDTKEDPDYPLYAIHEVAQYDIPTVDTTAMKQPRLEPSERESQKQKGIRTTSKILTYGMRSSHEIGNTESSLLGRQFAVAGNRHEKSQQFVGNMPTESGEVHMKQASDAKFIIGKDVSKKIGYQQPNFGTTGEKMSDSKGYEAKKSRPLGRSSHQKPLADVKKTANIGAEIVAGEIFHQEPLGISASFTISNKRLGNTKKTSSHEEISQHTTEKPKNNPTGQEFENIDKVQIVGGEDVMTKSRNIIPSTTLRHISDESMRTTKTDEQVGQNIAGTTNDVFSQVFSSTRNDEPNVEDTEGNIHGGKEDIFKAAPVRKSSHLKGKISTQNETNRGALDQTTRFRMLNDSNLHNDSDGTKTELKPNTEGRIENDANPCAIHSTTSITTTEAESINVSMEYKNSDSVPGGAESADESGYYSEPAEINSGGSQIEEDKKISMSFGSQETAEESERGADNHTHREYNELDVVEKQIPHLGEVLHRIEKQPRKPLHFSERFAYYKTGTRATGSPRELLQIGVDKKRTTVNFTTRPVILNRIRKPKKESMTRMTSEAVKRRKLQPRHEAARLEKNIPRQNRADPKEDKRSVSQQPPQKLPNQTNEKLIQKTKTHRGTTSEFSRKTTRPMVSSPIATGLKSADLQAETVPNSAEEGDKPSTHEAPHSGVKVVGFSHSSVVHKQDFRKPCLASQQTINHREILADSAELSKHPDALMLTNQSRHLKSTFGDSDVKYPKKTVKLHSTTTVVHNHASSSHDNRRSPKISIRMTGTKETPGKLRRIPSTPSDSEATTRWKNTEERTEVSMNAPSTNMRLRHRKRTQIQENSTNQKTAFSMKNRPHKMGESHKILTKG